PCRGPVLHPVLVRGDARLLPGGVAHRHGPSVSQPFSTSPSQSEEPSAQRRRLHTPSSHSKTPFGTCAQASPQAPQLASSRWRSTQALPHSVSPSAQAPTQRNATAPGSRSYGSQNG